jgi:hypothetical protein
MEASGRHRWRFCSGEPGQQASGGSTGSPGGGKGSTGLAATRPEGGAHRGHQ